MIASRLPRVVKWYIQAYLVYVPHIIGVLIGLNQKAGQAKRDGTSQEKARGYATHRAWSSETRRYGGGKFTTTI